MSAFAQQGRPVDEVIADLVALRADDVRWKDGRTFGLVYDGGPSVHAVAEAAATLYLHENALNTQAFPSLRQIQADTVGWTAGLLHGDADVAGFLTSGGTESILCAVLAARERAARGAWCHRTGDRAARSRPTPRSTRRRTTSG